MSNPLFETLVLVYQTYKTTTVDYVTDLMIHAPQYYGEWWSDLLKNHPQHIFIETTLIFFIIWLVFIRRTVDPGKSSKIQKLSKDEVNMLLQTWESDPLVPELTELEQNVVDDMQVITKEDGLYLTIEGIKEPVINLASFDFLGISHDLDVKQKGKEALDYYGCGSCGPRGFYGTIDQHLFFEEAIAKFMGTEEAISYSDGSSAVSSSIPAFSKKGDLLIIDEACYDPILTGANLSRSTVQFFKHNDMKDLETILESIAKDDKKLKRDTLQQRRFIIVEGLYRNVGDICPLPEILTLKEKYFYRVILDESTSFGCLGKTGRGVTEHYGLKTTDVEIITLAMDTVLASVGGVCIGTREFVDHQRLSGAGYCFSASAPPFLSACASEALKKIENNPEYFEKLQENVDYIHKKLKTLPGIVLRSSYPTAVIQMGFSDSVSKVFKTRDEECFRILKIVKNCQEKGVGIASNKFSLKNPEIKPSFFMNISVLLSKKDMDKIHSVLAEVIGKISK